MEEKGKKHPYFGHMSRHHLIPKQRLREYYGSLFEMSGNIFRLWRFRHDAWHILFEQQTLNETVKYLRRRPDKIYGYQTPVWDVLFKGKTNKEARKLLLRVRRIIRKKHAFLEFDPLLRNKAFEVAEKTERKNYSQVFLNKRFKIHRIKKPFSY